MTLSTDLQKLSKEQHVKLFKKAGIWIEDGTITPEKGDIVVFNWDDATQPNDGYSDHIGVVRSVGSKNFETMSLIRDIMILTQKRLY